MDVYIVVSGWDEDYRVIGVFSSEKLAARFVPDPRYRQIEHYVVDEIVEPFANGMQRWEVTLASDGYVYSSHELPSGTCWEGPMPEYLPSQKGLQRYCVYARDREHAHELARIADGQPAEKEVTTP